ncbi:MAG: TIGR00725 family protein, partial [Terriglobia bacterium]
MAQTPGRDLYISVIGSSRCGEDMVILAEQVGSAVAKAGAILVCGGLAGVMLGAAR